MGGGAAGCFAAANVDPSRFRVTLLEQNPAPLQKVKISGGGRCNVTHACFDPRQLVQFYPRGGRELRSVFHQFQPGDMMGWLAERGVETKTEEDGRVFPVTNTSLTIMDCLLQAMDKNGVDLRTKTTVRKITPGPNGFSVETGSETFSCTHLLMAPGSSPKAQQMVRDLGVAMVPQVPSLFTFNIDDPLLKDLPGTVFPEARVQIKSLKAAEEGPLLITHWGLSGPAVLRLSAWQAVGLAALDYRCEVTVNFLGISAEEALQEMEDQKKSLARRQMGTAKIFPVTQRFWLKALEICGIPPTKLLADLGKKDMRRLAELLTKKNLLMKGKSTFKDEFVTAGGIDLKEIDFRTMQCRKIPNLYFAGEILNIDGITGGFNFQACWSEGWVIAQHLNALQP